MRVLCRRLPVEVSACICAHVRERASGGEGQRIRNLSGHGARAEMTRSELPNKTHLERVGSFFGKSVIIFGYLWQKASSTLAPGGLCASWDLFWFGLSGPIFFPGLLRRVQSAVIRAAAPPCVAAQQARVDLRSTGWRFSPWLYASARGMGAPRGCIRDGLFCVCC